MLKPTTKSLPLVGGFQICFLERPNIYFDLDGIANIADWPILRRKVRRRNICPGGIFRDRSFTN